MQNLHKRLAITVITVCMFCYVEALGSEDGMLPPHGGGPMPPPPPPFGIHFLVKCQVDNLLIKTIAQMSNQTIETITTEFEENAPPYLLQKYGIDRNAFDSAMQAKIIEMVDTARMNGQITEDQALRIVEEINTHPFP